MNAERLVVTEHKGAKIKRCAEGVGNKIRLMSDVGGEYFKRHILVYLGKAHTLRGSVHSLYVFHRSEKLNVSVRSAISLEALEYFSTVMKNC